jgi:hypothetical protein
MMSIEINSLLLQQTRNNINKNEETKISIVSKLFREKNGPQMAGIKIRKDPQRSNGVPTLRNLD